ncbi:hypothetical protein C2E23DRAFT_96433 [Lenzites betulinus]|nr:hypothetical protein C2E23DRAFT_96433 [Lenzites betulinus]
MAERWCTCSDGRGSSRAWTQCTFRLRPFALLLVVVVVSSRAFHQLSSPSGALRSAYQQASSLPFPPRNRIALAPGFAYSRPYVVHMPRLPSVARRLLISSNASCETPSSQMGLCLYPQICAACSLPHSALHQRGRRRMEPCPKQYPS